MAKKQQLEAPQNIEAVTKTEAFFDKYQKQILYGICAIVVIAAAWIGYVQLVRNPNIQKANEALAKCENYFNADNYDKALNGDGQNMGFLAVADEFGCTKAGNLAHLYAGLCLYQTEKYQEAIDQLEDYSSCGDDMVSPSVIGTIGNCYAELGQNEKAVELLVKAAKKADNNTLSPLYLIQAGQIYETLGQAEKALDCYKQIKNKYQQSMQYSEIDKYIERVTK
jgi:tetratricopeptide (TPR) repeat protein